VAELQTADGSAVDPGAAETEAAFAAAMAADPEAAPEAAPPKRQPAPGEPPRRRGRPPKDKARVTAAAAPAAALSDTQRAEGVRGLVQIAAGFAVVSSRITGSDAWKADAITLASSADAWAGACVQVARADPKFGRVLDRVVSAGPYGALITVAVSTTLQLARNHRPAAQLPGTTDPAELIAAAEAASAGEASPAPAGAPA
jgi:hypothetical protein